MTTTSLNLSNTLRTALKANGSFSALSGLILTVASRPVATYMGFNQPAIYIGLGIVLLIFAADLWWLATRPRLNTQLATGVIALDILWIIGSALLLLTGWGSFNTAGRWLILIVADIVGIFALWQGYGLWRHHNSR